MESWSEAGSQDSFYPDQLAVWNSLSDWYHEKFSEFPLYDPAYQDFCQNIPANSPDVLDLGCGPGNSTQRLLEIRPDFRILGIDGAPAMVARARNEVPGARFERGTIPGFDIGFQAWSGIFCGFLIPYLREPDVETLLAAMHTGLKPEGALLLGYLEGSPGKSGWSRNSLGQKLFLRFDEPISLRRRAEACGFRCRREYHYSYSRGSETETHNWLLLQKGGRGMRLPGIPPVQKTDCDVRPEVV